MTRSLIVSSLLATCALAQTPTRVGDLLTTGSGLRNTDVLRGATTGSTLVFGAKQPATGYELWASDGTAAGTRLVTDLSPGLISSLGGSFTSHGGNVYFLANDGVREGLWRTDGTAANTTLVAGRRCETLKVVGTQLWCITTSAHLFVVDAANVGTDVAVSLFGQPWDGDALGQALYYPSSDGELWKADGVAATRVRDLRPTSTTHSLHSPVVRMGSRVYFAADDGVSGLELWTSDGTSAGTTLVTDIVAGSGGALVEGITIPVKLWATSTKVFFFARTGVGIELWVSDGTSAGTRLVGDLTPNGDTFTATSEIVVFQDQVFFSGGDGELWKSDGTPAGTVQVKDLLPGTSRASPSDFFVSGTQLFFTARNTGGFLELWRTDGTTAGTVLLAPRATLQPQSYALLGTIGSLTIFKAGDTVVGTEPWVTDGTPAGTRLLADLNPGPDYAFSSPGAFGRIGSSLLFVGRTAAGPLNLYRSNGTLAGTQVLKSGLTSVSAIVSNGSRAWFVSNRRDLWTTDGTAAGTVMLKQFVAQSFDDSATELTLTSSGLIFSGNDAATGQELWFSDGTINGTRLVKDMTPGATGTFFAGLVVFGGNAYFNLYSSTGTTVMKSDLTANGTVAVKDFPTDRIGSLRVAGAHLFGFVGSKNKVLVSDGTASGTNLLDLGTSTTFETSRLDVLGSLAIVRGVERNASGSADDVGELWVTDGTPANTQRLATLGAPWQSFLADNGWEYASVGLVGSSLVFPFVSLTTAKLWVTDGTPSGTKVLKDLAGNGRSDVAWNVRFGSAGGQLYFAASDGVNGNELWRTDGTTMGTTMVADLVPGAGSSSPAGFFLVEPNLYFSAFDASGDEELWKLDLGLDNTPPVITPVVTGTMGQAGWYTSNVGVSFQVTDPESAVSAMTGCAATTISMDTMSQTFTCTATSRGGTAMNSITVKRDATAPVFTCPMPQTVEATASSGALVSFMLPTANDAYSGMTPVQASSLSGGTFPLGDSDIVFTSTDAAGNVGRCTTRITVKDTIAPVITCPPDATLKSTSFGPPLLSVRATAMDVVDPMPMVTQSVGDGIALVLGSNRITATATDASGNHSSCEFTLLVEPADTGMTMNPMPMNPMPTGCGCSGGGVGPLLAGALLLFLRARARRTR